MMSPTEKDGSRLAIGSCKIMAMPEPTDLAVVRLAHPAKVRCPEDAASRQVAMHSVCAGGRSSRGRSSSCRRPTPLRFPGIPRGAGRR